jgi:hypothetical protein
MKNKSFGFKFIKILAALGCLILAVMVWLVVRYGQAGQLPITMTPFG